jgi:hypothetical protein
MLPCSPYAVCVKHSNADIAAAAAEQHVPLAAIYHLQGSSSLVS